MPTMNKKNQHDFVYLVIISSNAIKVKPKAAHYLYAYIFLIKGTDTAGRSMIGANPVSRA